MPVPDGYYLNTLIDVIHVVVRTVQDQLDDLVHINETSNEEEDKDEERQASQLKW